MFLVCITGLRVSGGRSPELARVDDRPMQELDGQREALDRKQMVVRSPDGAAQSVRAIAPHVSRCPTASAPFPLPSAADVVVTCGGWQEHDARPPAPRP